MSTIFKLAAIGAVSFAAMATSAQAQSRYGDIMAYEGGAADCDPANCATAVQSSRYGAPVMVDCSVFGSACGPQVVAQPTTVYTQPVHQTYAQTYTAEPANCPAGTTMQADGTCMQMGSSYTTTQTYTQSSTAMAADCPAGTTMQADGTCLQGSMTTYSAQPAAPVMTVECPMGTTKQPDGTCAQTATVYSGDATPSYGYESSGSYGVEAYRPIRK